MTKRAMPLGGLLGHLAAVNNWKRQWCGVVINAYHNYCNGTYRSRTDARSREHAELADSPIPQVKIARRVNALHLCSTGATRCPCIRSPSGTPDQERIEPNIFSSAQLGGPSSLPAGGQNRSSVAPTLFPCHVLCSQFLILCVSPPVASIHTHLL